jgi:hypothetical protein
MLDTICPACSDATDPNEYSRVSNMPKSLLDRLPRSTKLRRRASAAAAGEATRLKMYPNGAGRPRDISVSPPAELEINATP